MRIISWEEIQDFSRPFAPPCLLLLGGETTVSLQGRGKGGRNQELAGDLLFTGSTGTNVNDVVLVYIDLNSNHT